MFDLALRSKPVLKWAGGKTNLLPRLLESFPDRFDRYIEPFLGGASIFLALRSGTPAIINDSIPDLMVTYRIIRDVPEKLMKALDEYAEKYSACFFLETRGKIPVTEIERAARFIFLNKTCFNGLYRTNSEGRFNVPFGKRVRCPALYDRQGLLAVSERLASARIMNCDFEAVLASARKGDFIYCDPPYVPLSRTASFNSYTPGGFRMEDHQRLRNACDAARAKGAVVVITNSSSPAVRRLYSGWAIRTVRVPRFINSKGNRRGAVKEVVAIAR